MYLVPIYLLLLFLCLAFSIYKKKARQNFLWLYFVIVFIVEFIKIKVLKNSSSVIYTYISITYILYFIIYYWKQKLNKIILILIFIISFIIYIYIILNNNSTDYPTPIGIIMSLSYILLALLWYIHQLQNVDTIRILKKQAFWVSSSLLIWSVFFIFRSIPMYWLNIHDYDFLIQINFGFQIITIFSYLLFLRGLFCKI